MKGEAVAIGIDDPSEATGGCAERAVGDRYFLREKGFQSDIEVSDLSVDVAGTIESADDADEAEAAEEAEETKDSEA